MELTTLHHGGSDEFIAVYDPRVPACMVLDLSADRVGGLTILRELAARGIMLPTLILGSGDDTTLAVAAIKAGANGYASLPADPRRLDEHVVELLQQAQPAAEKRVAIQQLQSAIRKLSQREHEVFLKIAAGRSVKQIANELALSNRTVHIYRTNCLRKMGVETVIELVCLMTGAPKGFSEARPAAG